MAATLGSQKDEAGRTRASKAIRREREQVIQSLLAVVRDKRQLYQNSKSAEAAMELLGEYRAVEAVPTLVELVEYFPSVGMQSDIQDRINFPALRALIRIGKPSVAPAVAYLRKHGLKYEKFNLRSLVPQLIKAVHGDSGLRILRSALEEEKDPGMRDLLEKIIDKYDGIVLREDLLAVQESLYPAQADSGDIAHE